VTAATELHLARKYYPLRRYEEMMTHLADARRISLYEGDPAVTEEIAQVIAGLRMQAP